MVARCQKGGAYFLCFLTAPCWHARGPEATWRAARRARPDPWRVASSRCARGQLWMAIVCGDWTVKQCGAVLVYLHFALSCECHPPGAHVVGQGCSGRPHERRSRGFLTWAWVSRVCALCRLQLSLSRLRLRPLASPAVMLRLSGSTPTPSAPSKRCGAFVTGARPVCRGLGDTGMSGCRSNGWAKLSSFCEISNCESGSWSGRVLRCSNELHSLDSSWTFRAG